MDFAAKVQEIMGWSETQYAARQAAYDLLKLRYKQIVERAGKSRRYIAVTAGIRTVCALLTLREKVIKPLVAAAGKLALGANPRTMDLSMLITKTYPRRCAAYSPHSASRLTDNKLSFGRR